MELFFGINLLRDFVVVVVLPPPSPTPSRASPPLHVTSIIYGYDSRIVCLKFGILSRLDPILPSFRPSPVSLRCKVSITTGEGGRIIDENHVNKR